MVTVVIVVVASVTVLFDVFLDVADAETIVTYPPMASKTEHFKAFFSEAMKRGVYLPPSAFETCFISTAHEDGDLDRAAEALTGALKAI